jgi:hypothetical protein
MSAQVHILVEFIDGKPNLTLGASSTQKTRSFQVKGAAENYGEMIQQDVIRSNEYWRKRIEHDLQSKDAFTSARAALWQVSKIQPVPDIRILSVTIPDDGPVDGLYDGLLAVPAMSWS